MMTNGESKTPPSSERGRWRVWVLVIGVVAVLVVLAFVVPQMLKPTQPDAYEIGVVLPLSGNLAYVGKMEGDGMRLAVEEINANGGINGVPLRLLFGDSQGKPDVGVTATQHLMTGDGVNVVVGSISSVVLGMKPVVVRNGGILIGCCMHPDFYRDSPNVFRFYEGVEDEARGFVEYLSSVASKESKPRVGILYVEVPNVVEQIEDYIRPGIAKAGLDFVVMEPYRLSDKEFRDKILKIRAAKLTHLVVLGYGFLYPNIFRELREQKVLPGVQLVGGWGFLYPNLPNEQLEDTVVVGPEYAFADSDKIALFHTRFKKRFGYGANFDAAMTYAAIELLAAGLRGSPDQSPSLITESLRSLKKTQTLIGIVSVNDDGAMMFPVGVGTFRSGRVRALGDTP